MSRRSELENPIRTSRQWGYMQAARSGAPYAKTLSAAVAEEMIHKTPKGKRSKFAKELATKRNASSYSFYFRDDDSRIPVSVVDKYVPDNLEPYARQADAKKAARLITKGTRREVYIKSLGGFKMNPDNELEAARGLSHEWHGRPSEEVIDVEVVEQYDSTVVDLGELEEIGIVENDYEHCYEIVFKSSRPTLVANLDKNNIELVGGDQSLSLNTQGKREVDLGYMYSIAYYTDKHHLEDSDGNFSSYVHYLGEEYYRNHGYNIDDYEDDEEFFDAVLEDGIVEDAIKAGYLPSVIYNTVNKTLRFVGGKYEVTELGLRN